MNGLAWTRVGGEVMQVEALALDGTGTLEYKLPAQMDEFIMTSDVLTEADVAALKAYYE